MSEQQIITPDPTPAPAAPVVIDPAPVSPTPPAASPHVSPPTLLAGDIQDKPVAAPTDWPADWRDKFAGGDDKAKTRLARFGSPLDIFKSFRELEAKLSSGKVRSELPENPTEEQLSAYRRDNGIPEDGKYDTDLGGGFVWADGDKQTLDDFSKFAHDANMPQSEFKKSLAWYATFQQRQQETVAERDQQFRAQSEDALRQEFGAEFRRNVNAVGALIGSMPEDVRGSFLLARMPDGRLIGDHPEVIRFLARTALELNPAATVIPGHSGDPMKSIGDRKAEIQKMMGDRSSEYWRGPKSVDLQKEFRDLVEAEQKLKSRNAA